MDMRENQPSTEGMNDDMTRCALHPVDPQHLLLLAGTIDGDWRQQEGGSREVGIHTTQAMVAAFRDQRIAICSADKGNRDFCLRGDRGVGGIEFTIFAFVVYR